MPVTIRKLPSGGYQVRHGNRISAKRTTRTKATNQAKLLRALDHGYNPSQRRHRTGKGKGRVI